MLMPKLNQKGIAHLALLLILLAGVVVGTSLVQQRTNIIPHAQECEEDCEPAPEEITYPDPEPESETVRREREDAEQQEPTPEPEIQEEPTPLPDEDSTPPPDEEPLPEETPYQTGDTDRGFTAGNPDESYWDRFMGGIGDVVGGVVENFCESCREERIERDIAIAENEGPDLSLVEAISDPEKIQNNQKSLARDLGLDENADLDQIIEKFNSVPNSSIRVEEENGEMVFLMSGGAGSRYGGSYNAAALTALRISPEGKELLDMAGVDICIPGAPCPKGQILIFPKPPETGINSTPSRPDLDEPLIFPEELPDTGILSTPDITDLGLQNPCPKIDKVISASCETPDLNKPGAVVSASNLDYQGLPIDDPSDKAKVAVGLDFLKQAYPDRNYRVFSTEGSSGVVFIDDENPNILYKVDVDMVTQDPKANDHDKVRTTRYFEAEAQKIKILSEEGIAPRLITFIEPHLTAEQQALKNSSDFDDFFPVNNAMKDTPFVPSYRNSDTPIIVMEKVDIDPDGFLKLDQNKAKKEREINKIASILERLNFYPGDTELVVDRQGNLLYIDLGGMVPIVTGNPRSESIQEAFDQTVRERVADQVEARTETARRNRRQKLDNNGTWTPGTQSTFINPVIENIFNLFKMKEVKAAGLINMDKPVKQEMIYLANALDFVSNKLATTGEINTDEIKNNIVKNLKIPQKGIKNDSKIWVSTDSKGFINFNAKKSKYKLDANTTQGIDISIPEEFDLTKNTIIPIGIRTGSGNIKKVSKDSLIDDDVVSGNGSDISVKVVLFNDQNGNGKWNRSENISPWAGLIFMLEDLNYKDTQSTPGSNLNQASQSSEPVPFYKIYVPQ